MALRGTNERLHHRRKQSRSTTLCSSCAPSRSSADGNSGVSGSLEKNCNRDERASKSNLRPGIRKSPQEPSEEIRKRDIRRQRSSVYPSTPASLNDLVLDGVCKTTSGLPPEPSVIYDNGPQARSRIVAFATAECLRLFCQSNTLLMNRNFAMAPRLCLQL